MKKFFLFLIICQVLLCACSPTPEAPTETDQTNIADYLPGVSYFNMEFEGMKRFYMVFLPESYSKAEKYPLVIYLHSYGWGAQKGMDYTRFNGVADKFGFMIAYPDARYNWNSGIGDDPDWGTPDNDDVGFINVMLDEINENFNIDERRIYATGYSNGGFMAYKLACQLSHRIAAVASVSGVLSESTLVECDPNRPIPILQIHGTSDGYVSIDGSEGWHSVEETLDFWLQENSCTDMEHEVLEDINTSDESTVERFRYSNCGNESTILFYKVINGGHTWPGADRPGYPAGKTNLDFDASFVIWEFFNDYQMPQ